MTPPINANRTIWQRISRVTSRTVIGISIASLVAMWIYAFGFASKESVNKIDDEAWTQRAEGICKQAMQERLALADLRQISDAGVNALSERADLVDKATDTLEEAITEISEVSPSDAKGRAIVPLWIADYKQLIKDRRDYAALLRTGVNEPFSESTFEGLPISEKISTFAADNRMTSCKIPMDLSI
ncbi:MAG: hypothetical protein ACOVLJ_03440 [Ilumatobacteraceae bacterium]